MPSRSRLNLLLIALTLFTTVVDVAIGQTSGLQTSFEQAEPGSFTTLNSSIGLWKTVQGRVLVDDQHASSGTQCLQLAGGPNSSVELIPYEQTKTDGYLAFKAERWTKRSPFSFRVEKCSNGNWSEIYNGDKRIRVGRPFLSSVDVQLADPNITKLRFTVTSPANTGILIDDLRIAPAAPQKITNVEVVPLALPALVGTDYSALLKLKIETTGRKNPISLNKIRFGLSDETSPNDVAGMRVFFTGSASTFLTTTPFGDLTKPASKTEVAGQQTLVEGANYVWVACSLNTTANIDHRVGVVCEAVTFSNAKTFRLQPNASVQNIGVAVRNRGLDGVHTYRIPGLATTKRGTLIAVYDVRHRSSRDLPGDIDVGMSRSTDGGRTWEPMKVIIDMGDDPTFRYDGVGDPTVLVDKTTGTIWCAATWSHGNRSWVGSQPGLKPEQTGQFILVRSDDDGPSWSKPINITRQVKKPEWSFLLNGPGKGITMQDGTLVFPAQYQDPPNAEDEVANRLPHSAFIFSRDHGTTWQTSTAAYDDTTESQIVELEPGQLMINCRYNRADKRVVMTTTDMGRTWTEHSTSRKTLVEPRACMASLINVGRELRQLGVSGQYIDRNDFLLFSNPDSIKGRDHITIKASLDGGKTWPREHHLLLDEERGAGYSCMTMVDGETVGILYEGSQAHMTFQRVKLADILAPPKNQKTSNPSQATFRSASTIDKPVGSTGVRFARTFGDHMVLQANQPIRIWGHASPRKAVTVRLGMLSTKTTSSKSGYWQASLPKQKYNSRPQVLEATSEGTTQTVRDVLVGEVWLCAGQSNMEWPLKQSDGGEGAIAESADPMLRLMNFAGSARGGASVYDEAILARLAPNRFSSGEWLVAGPTSSASFSAVGYYFARQLRAKLDCPTGMINVSIGGTPIESWISSEALSTHPELNSMMSGNWLTNPVLDEWCQTRAKLNMKRVLSGELVAPSDQNGPNHSFKPGFMYTAAVAPFVPMSIRGVLWYQGESNAESPDRVRQYDLAFPLLLNSWRQAFRNPDLPVAFVQLPAMGRVHWPLFREHQRRCLSRLSNVGMAVTIDTGQRNNVHPRQKQVVGNRLAAWVLARTYGHSGPAAGPLFESARYADRDVVLSFDTDGDSLTTTNGKPPNNFELAGDDGVFHPATAIVSSNTIRLTSDQVAKPKNARYAFRDFPEPKPNLSNSHGLPASPFTTETLAASTESPTEAVRLPESNARK
ncbi:MAG: exo-alpha-sialidase [Planctomycetaceae bacterium]